MKIKILLFALIFSFNFIAAKENLTPWKKYYQNELKTKGHCAFLN